MISNLPYHDKPSPWSSHSIIAKHLDALPAQSKILDVGTASGTLARICQNNSLRLFGIEPNVTWAQMASALYEKIWACSVEEMEEESLREYNAVVLGDVLEHMSAPEVVLQKLVRLQSSGTLFIISVPNVANLWVRLNLLIGRFDYADRGILDRTHLRFFTRKTFLALVKNSGLEIITTQVTPIPLELVSKFFVSPPGKLVHAALASLTSWLPTLLGYQFIVKARKP